ncbi:LCP family protein [Nocardioides sp. B-3]|uniref:LCP family protein n=1 Tax=Nocardioides sp. B-3 TaxID=2895565 RepID=UPI0021534504|nr:LCP family protein [Nocardioides sp. B-3]UUZ60623.1 LCP family protein [Nocardioides sp. B-3]
MKVVVVVDVTDANSRTIARVILTSCVVLAMMTALGTVLTYRHLNGNLTTVPGIEEIDDRPEVLYEGDGQPLNIPVMGSDSREGDDNDIDGEDPANGARSDTTVVLHISADRESAYGISIPRDSVVDRPDCGDDNEIAGETDAKWNAAFSFGGPLCAVEQVEQTTGIRIDDFVVIDFNGFKEMVDAVGGVEICVPEEIDDPAKQIFVPAGTNVLRGDRALDYVRVRDNVGSESDLGRIKRQQNFMASMINKVVSSGTLTRPDRVIKFLSAATGSLVTSEGLDSVRELGDLAVQLRRTGLDDIRFVTVPWEYDDEYGVHWLPESKGLFRSAIMDEPLSAKLSSDAIDAGRPRGSEEGSTGSSSEAADNGLCS